MSGGERVRLRNHKMFFYQYFVGALAVAVLAGVGGCTAGGSSARPSGRSEGSLPVATVALVGATVIDGTGRSSIDDAVVVVRGEHIVAVGPRASFAIPAAARIVDVDGRWIIPGMIDAHAHFFESGRIYSKPGAIDLTRFVSYADEVRWTKARVPVTLARYLCAGVTSVVSAGGPRFEYEVRDAARTLSMAPNVYVAHGPITAARIGHDVFPLIDGDESTRHAADLLTARAEIDKGAAWDADLIKVGYLGGLFAAEEMNFFAMLPGVVTAAHDSHMLVTAHVTELDAARRAIAAGVDSLAHTVTDADLDDAFLKAALERRIVNVSTLAIWTRDIAARSGAVPLTPMEIRCGDPEVIRSWTEVGDLPPVASAEAQWATTAQQMAMTNVKRLHERGVALAVGVDAGNLGLLHGASFHAELALLAEAGIPTMDIIVAATRNAARVAGKESEVGTIEAGKLADLVVLKRNPLADIRNAADIEYVMKGGVLLAAEALLP